MKSINELYIHLLRDVLHAEKQILRALPKMAKQSESKELRQALETHREETQGQVERLEQVFELAGQRARAVPCEAIKGLIEEAQEVMQEVEVPAVRDVAILCSAQAVEHYEIARYGSLVELAKLLGQDEAAELLAETLAEEKKTDALLNELAKSSVNDRAAETATEMARRAA